MKFKWPLTLLLTFVVFCQAGGIAAEEKNRWRDAQELTIEGRGWEDTKNDYDRFPERAQKTLRPVVWGLSLNSAGICVRFVTDATSISARWTLRRESLSMPHMPASGVSGLDLYMKEKGKWHWVGAGRPKEFPTNEVTLVNGLVGAEREYALYLPLYNGVTSVHVGVPANARLEPAAKREVKPIVFYGTSILHGGCASRPGMAYPAIIGRHQDWPTINLGFSGNAWSEPEVADLLAELDPAVYVIDPLPNMTADRVRERIEPMVKKIREARPQTPIILVESVEYTDGPFVKTRRERYESSNAALAEVYKQIKKSGIKNVHYIPGPGLLGDDGEGTVDGTHPTDLGFLRMAEKIGPKVGKFLKR